jgi:hypothetical protein
MIFYTYSGLGMKRGDKIYDLGQIDSPPYQGYNDGLGRTVETRGGTGETKGHEGEEKEGTGERVEAGMGETRRDMRKNRRALYSLVRENDKMENETSDGDAGRGKDSGEEEEIREMAYIAAYAMVSTAYRERGPLTAEEGSALRTFFQLEQKKG